MGEAILVSGIISGVVGASSISESRKARKQRERAGQIQQKSARLQSARQAVEQVRAAQVARAQTLAQAEAQGVAGSSAVQGALGSIQSQAGSNIAFSNQIFQLQSQANARLRSAARHQGMSQDLAGLSNIVGETNWGELFK